MEEQSPQRVSDQDRRIYWDWWSENPVEIVVVLLIIVLFFTVPWQGCGITATEPGEEIEETRVVP